jgi:hypothetical protein
MVTGTCLCEKNLCTNIGTPFFLQRKVPVLMIVTLSRLTCMKLELSCLQPSTQEEQSGIGTPYPTRWLMQIVSNPWRVVRDSSVVWRHYIFLLEPWDVRELYIRKTADLPLRLLVGTFPRFVSIRFYFLSETLI